MEALERDITQQVKSGHQITDIQITHLAKQRILHQINYNYISFLLKPMFDLSKL